jgi:hypothetical protein
MFLQPFFGSSYESFVQVRVDGVCAVYTLMLCICVRVVVASVGRCACRRATPSASSARPPCPARAKSVSACHRARWSSSSMSCTARARMRGARTTARSADSTGERSVEGAQPVWSEQWNSGRRNFLIVHSHAATVCDMRCVGQVMCDWTHGQPQLDFE